MVEANGNFDAMWSVFVQAAEVNMVDAVGWCREIGRHQGRHLRPRTKATSLAKPSPPRLPRVRLATTWRRSAAICFGDAAHVERPLARRGALQALRRKARAPSPSRSRLQEVTAIFASGADCFTLGQLDFASDAALCWSADMVTSGCQEGPQRLGRPLFSHGLRGHPRGHRAGRLLERSAWARPTFA